MPLVSEYQTDEIKDVCGQCLYEMNQHLAAVQKLQRKILFNWMKRFFIALREKYQKA